MRYCPVDGSDAGFPNVRAAERGAEADGLRQRFDDALASAHTRGCADRIDEFRSAVSESKAVLCRPLSRIQKLVSSDNELYNTFYQEVAAQGRIPESNLYDLGRASIDSILFPNYWQDIVFAALSLDGRGPTGYGDFTLVLREETISSRASVFEESSFLFFKRMKILAGGSVPPSYRAPWRTRDQLAVAKLASRVEPATDPAEFPEVLLEPSGKTDADFIEVHIYGPIHRRAVEKLVAKVPNKRADMVILSSVKRKLAEIGATVESYK